MPHDGCSRELDVRVVSALLPALEPPSSQQNTPASLRAFTTQIAPAVALLQGLLDLGSRLRDPTLDSPLERERQRQSNYAGDWGAEPIDDAEALIHLLLTAGESHIWSVIEILNSDRSGPASLMVLSRAAVEALARAVWLAEPTLGLEERLRRSMEELLSSLREQLALGLNEDRARRRIDAILSTADKIGIGTLPPAKRKPRRLKNRPTATNLVAKLMLDHGGDAIGALTYKLWSASAHGTAYGLGRFVDRITDPSVGRPLGVVRMSSTEVIQTLWVLVGAYALANQVIGQLCGVSDDEWTRSVANANAYFKSIGERWS